MYYTYVIYSPGIKRYYKGHCGNLELRLSEHNKGKVKSTKAYRPWEYVYYEEFETMELAVAREKYFKTAAGRRFLKLKIK
jgi:putative endonuclease